MLQVLGVNILMPIIVRAERVYYLMLDFIIIIIIIIMEKRRKRRRIEKK